jgi:hypothetical protein
VDQCRIVEPVFVERALGDGKKLLAVMPLETRPNYYLIRVDSTWNDSNGGGSTLICEHLDEILEAIRAQCGSANQGQRKNGNGNGRHNSWPALSYSSGVSWFAPSDLPELPE